MLAHSLGITLISHPPIEGKYRQIIPFGTVLTEDTYLARNRAIVDQSSELVVLPAESEKPYVRKGGTWYTYKYALGKDKPVTVYYA